MKANTANTGAITIGISSDEEVNTSINASGLALIAMAQMRTWSRGKTKPYPKQDNSNNKLLLMNPFDVEDAKLSAASSGLKKLGGDLLNLG